MALTEDLTQLEHQLGELITRYEQYFIGLEKREPLPLLDAVDRLVRRHASTPITNTMYKHKYQMLVARLNTYREHWRRILRLIDEGRYSRDRFISDLRQRQGSPSPPIPRQDSTTDTSPSAELDRIYQELRQARQACHLPVDKLSRETVAATLEKSKPSLIARLGSDDLVYRVVIENGKPKIKASLRKQHQEPLSFE